MVVEVSRICGILNSHPKVWTYMGFEVIGVNSAKAAKIYSVHMGIRCCLWWCGKFYSVWIDSLDILFLN